MAATGIGSSSTSLDAATALSPRSMSRDTRTERAWRSIRRGMTVAAIASKQPFAIARIPVRSWTFAIRVWLAMILALFVSFWLQLEAPASAALTVGILAEPTRGQALGKAGC